LENLLTSLIDTRYSYYFAQHGSMHPCIVSQWNKREGESIAGLSLILDLDPPNQREIVAGG
jgi:hypothetical protein